MVEFERLVRLGGFHADATRFGRIIVGEFPVLIGIAGVTGTHEEPVTPRRHLQALAACSMLYQVILQADANG